MVEMIGKGNPGFIQKMVSLFLEQVPKDLEKMKESVALGEWDPVSKIAHKMKPSIEGMGIALLKDPIRDIETKTHNNEPLNEVQLSEKVAFVNSIMEKVLDQLRHDYPDSIVTN